MILGRTFIQVSTSDFVAHNNGSANIQNAFKPYRQAPYNQAPYREKNQIELALDEMFGPNHSAKMVDNKFVVTKDDIPLLDFHIVYIHVAPGKPKYLKTVSKFPDLLHIIFEEIKEKLFNSH